VGEWRYSFNLIELDSRWRSVVSFTSLPVFPQGKSPRHLFVKKFIAPPSQFGRCEEKKNLMFLLGIE
jgi:hypothetical protein